MWNLAWGTAVKQAAIRPNNLKNVCTLRLTEGWNSWAHWTRSWTLSCGNWTQVTSILNLRPKNMRSWEWWRLDIFQFIKKPACWRMDRTVWTTIGMEVNPLPVNETQLVPTPLWKLWVLLSVRMEGLWTDNEPLERLVVDMACGLAELVHACTYLLSLDWPATLPVSELKWWTERFPFWTWCTW